MLAGFELASGLVAGPDRGVPELAAEPAQSTRDAFEAALLRALQRPPAVVAFSGGRDSSALLALAASLARRHGLPMPIPATNVFLGEAGSDETAWQERVVRHLGLEDWARFSWRNELDLIGPVAEGVLRRFGPVFPMNAHFILPLAEAASGGTLVTGAGGDELFTLGSWFSVLRRLPALARKDVLSAVGAVPPERVRRVLYRRFMPEIPWLTADGKKELRRRLAAWEASFPRRWSSVILNAWWRSRSRLGAEKTLQALAAPFEVEMLNPFMAPEVLIAAAAAHPLAGFPSRSLGMSEIFGDLLPTEILQRTSKATFDRAFFTSTSREFALNWDGEGADELMLDIGALRQTWLADNVDARSYSVLQGLWYRSKGLGRVEPFLVTARCQTERPCNLLTSAATAMSAGREASPPIGEPRRPVPSGVEART